MREIRLRAWDKKVKEWIAFVDLAVQATSSLMTFRKGERKYNEEGIELMQFTGLKASNGNEIYEGDIVMCLSGDDAYQTVVDDPILGDWVYLNIKEMGLKSEDLKVIGNVYQNTELLTK